MKKQKEILSKQRSNGIKRCVKRRFVWVVWKKIFNKDTPILIQIFNKENDAWIFKTKEQQKDMAYHYWMDKQTCV